MDREEGTAEGEARVAALRAQGAAAWNPVRFAFLEALARRTSTHQGSTRQWLALKLAGAVQTYEAGWQQARRQADAVLSGTMVRFPPASVELKRLHAAGDVQGLQRLADRLAQASRARPLADLVVRRPVPATSPTGEGRSTTPPGAGSAPLTELSTLQYFQNTWLRLSMDQRLSRSATQVPAQAGPLNSQVLALRSLQLMREVSPAYLQSFMAYLDTLLWLEQAGQRGAPLPIKELTRGEGERKAREPKDKDKASRRKS
ncbi:MAG: DUF2894 domain-containing protein [Pseudomonadota bacterium]